MPKKKRSTRDEFKRKIDQLDGHYQTIEMVLSEMFHIYHADNPDITLDIAMLLETNNEQRKAIKRFRNSF